MLRSLILLCVSLGLSKPILAQDLLLPRSTGNEAYSESFTLLADLDDGSCAVHLCLAVLRSRVWWEYVESKANWADEASRGGDNLLRRNGFQLWPGFIPTWPWTCSAVDRVKLLKEQFETA